MKKIRYYASVAALSIRQSILSFSYFSIWHNDDKKKQTDSVKK